MPGALLGGLLLVRFLDETTSFLPDGAIEQLRADLAIGYTAITVLFAAPFLGSLPALALVGRSDRTGRRAIVLGGAALMTAALAWFAAGTSFASLFAAAAMWGFAATLVVSGAEIELAVQARGGPSGELARRLRHVNLWGTAGDVAGPVLLALTLVAGGTWRTAFWIAAGMTAALGIGLARIRFAPAGTTADDEHVDEGHPAVAPHRDPVAWRLGVIALLLMPFDETWLAFLVAWLQVEGGWSEAPAVLAATAAVVGAAIGFGPLAAAARRFSDRDVLVASIVVTGIAGASVDLLPPWLAVVAGVAINASIAVAWVTLQHAVLVLRPGAEGRVSAFVSLIEHLAFALAIGIGIVADRAGVRWAFVPFAVIAGLGVLVARSLPRPTAGRRTSRRR